MTLGEEAKAFIDARTSVEQEGALKRLARACGLCPLPTEFDNPLTTLTEYIPVFERCITAAADMRENCEKLRELLRRAVGLFPAGMHYGQGFGCEASEQLEHKAKKLFAEIDAALKETKP
jgi:hypothetical protein